MMELPVAVETAYAQHRAHIERLAGTATKLTCEEHGTWYIRPADAEGRIARFSIRAQPGCAPILVFYNVEVAEGYRRRGLGSNLHALRLCAARLYGACVLQATTLVGNEAQNTIMLGHKWNVIATFDNERTGNRVHLWQRGVA